MSDFLNGALRFMSSLFKHGVCYLISVLLIVALPMICISALKNIYADPNDGLLEIFLTNGFLYTPDIIIFIFPFYLVNLIVLKIFRFNSLRSYSIAGAFQGLFFVYMFIKLTGIFSPLNAYFLITGTIFGVFYHNIEKRLFFASRKRTAM